MIIEPSKEAMEQATKASGATYPIPSDTSLGKSIRAQVSPAPKPNR